MRGSDGRSGSLFSYVDLEARVPQDHALRAIRRIADGALRDLSPDFAMLYAPNGRPSRLPAPFSRGVGELAKRPRRSCTGERRGA